MTVRQRLLANETERAAILATACATCRHPYHDHQRDGGVCYHHQPTDGECDCDQFTDPGRAQQ